jgi:hypothetical protein
MIFRSRYNYWCCSKIADFIRGTPKPFALEWGEWENWHKEAKSKHPYRYWLAETGLKNLQNIVMFPSDLYHSIETYIHNRWISKTHFLNTGLEPGHYYEFDYRVLHGLFNELVDYVEMELAHVSKYSKEKKYKFKNGRCVEAAMDYFDWACSLVYNEEYGISKDDDHYGQITPQALSARKVKELYLWWKETRPNRIEPYDAVNMQRFQGNEFSSKKSKEEIRAMHKMTKLEEQYDKEDTNKLIELIKIRKEIWT